MSFIVSQHAKIRIMHRLGGYASWYKHLDRCRVGRWEDCQACLDIWGQLARKILLVGPAEVDRVVRKTISHILAAGRVCRKGVSWDVVTAGGEAVVVNAAARPAVVITAYATASKAPPPGKGVPQFVHDALKSVV
jgi:hypothetical protein